MPYAELSIDPRYSPGVATTPPPGGGGGGAVAVDPNSIVRRMVEHFYPINVTSISAFVSEFNTLGQAGTATRTNSSTGSWYRMTSVGVASIGYAAAAQHQLLPYFGGRLRFGPVTGVQYQAGFFDVFDTGLTETQAARNWALFHFNAATSANWLTLVNDGAGAPTIFDTGVAVVQDQIVELEVLTVDANTIEFYIDGVLVNTETTNLPSAAVSMTENVRSISTGGSRYFEQQTVTVARN